MQATLVFQSYRLLTVSRNWNVLLNISMASVGRWRLDLLLFFASFLVYLWLYFCTAATKVQCWTDIVCVADIYSVLLIVFWKTAYFMLFWSTVAFRCPRNENGHFPDTSDCSVFHVCVNGRDFRLSCGNRLRYNPTLKVCDYPEKVNCY